MRYSRTVNEEIIFFDNNDASINKVKLVKYGNELVFSVFVYCSDNIEWIWEFDMSYPSNYERVKMCILDVAFGYDTLDELACALDEIFCEGFSEILTFRETPFDEEDDYEDYKNENESGTLCFRCDYRNKCEEYLKKIGDK